MFIPRWQRAALQTMSTAVHAGGMATGGEGRGLGLGQSPVLRIIVENLFYPVTLEVLQQVLLLLLLFVSRHSSSPP